MIYMFHMKGITTLFVYSYVYNWESLVILY